MKMHLYDGKVIFGLDRTLCGVEFRPDPESMDELRHYVTDDKSKVTCKNCLRVLGIKKEEQKKEVSNMKVSEIKKQLDEYDKLQKLIDEIDSVISGLIKKPRDFELAEGGIVNCEISFGANFYDASKKTSVYNNVKVNEDLTKLVKFDLIKLLGEHKDRLIQRQRDMTVE